MVYRTPDWGEEDWRKSYQSVTEAAVKFLSEIRVEKFHSLGLNTEQTVKCINLSEYQHKSLPDLLCDPERSGHVDKCAFCISIWNHRVFIDNPLE